MSHREASSLEAPVAPGSAVAGTLGVLGGLLWLAALLVEYRFDLFPPGQGAGYVVDQLVFAAAMVCYVTVLLGLRRAGAAGVGRGARVIVAIWASGWSLVLLGLASALLAPDLALGEVLPAVGGLVTAVFGVATGILVARAGVWRGWQRAAPLAVSCYVVLALFVPELLGAEPSLPTEAGWALGYAVIGAALRTATSRQT